MRKLTILAGLLVILTTLTSAIEVTDIKFYPSNPEAGERIEVTASAEGDDLEYIEARLPRESEFDSRNCGIGPCDNEDDPWYFTPESSGSYTVEVRAGSLFEQSSTLEETIQVDSSSSEIPVSLDSVSATRYELSESQSTQLQATLTNSGNYGNRVKIVWKADDGSYSYELDSTTQSISSGSTEALDSGILSYSDLQDTGLDAGEEYSLEAEYYFDSNGDRSFQDSELVSTVDAPESLVLFQEQQSGELTLDSAGATRTDISEDDATQLQTQISSTYTDYPREVTVEWYAEDGDESFFLDESTETVQEDSTEQVVSDFLYWQDLRGIGLSTEQDYTLEARLFFDGDQISSIQASNDIVLRESADGTDGFQIESVSPSGDVSSPLDITAETSDSDPTNYYQCEWDTQSPIRGLTYRIMDRSGSTFTDSDVDLSEGSYTVYVGCFDTTSTTSDEYLDTASTSFTVTDTDDGDGGGEDEDTEDPDADLDIRPTYSDTGEEVTFDATDSTDNDEIDRYKFDFDDDGNWDRTDYDGTYSRDFDDEYSGDARVKVIDESGNSDIARDYYSVSDDDDDDYDADEGDLEVTVRDDEGDRLDDAYVSVRNGDDRSGHTGSNGEIGFNNLETGDYGLYVRCESDTESESIEVDEGSNYETVYMDFDSSDNECDSDDEEEETEQDPEARFGWTPNNPEEGEEVEFDAASSSDEDGSIVDYSWRFGDGDSNSGRTVAHTYEDSGSYPVILTVEDNDGNRDSKTHYISIGQDPDACGVTDSSLRFTLDDYTITRGESTDAELTIFNTGTEDQKVEVNIKVSRNIVEQRTVTVSAQDSRTITESISPERDQFVTAEVSTVGGPCGSNSLNDITRELTVLSGGDEDASLDVEVYNENNNPVDRARVEVDGPEDRTRFTDSDGETGFELQAGDYDVTVSHPRYETETESVELFEGDEEEIDFTLRESDDFDEDDGTLEVTVLDEQGDYIEDAEVEVENGEDRTGFTDRYGFTSFRLEEGGYDITVSSPDYEEVETGYAYIESGETDSRTFRLDRYDDREQDGIEITPVDYPSSVCRGNTLSVDYTVRNNENYDESAQTTATGFGSNIVTNSFVIDSGDSVSGTLRFTNVQGSGTESFTIRVQNGTSDRVTRSVTVEDCTVSTPEQDTSGVSMKLSYPISPNRALVGDTVKVSGFVDGVNRRTNVNIDVNGDHQASVSTQPDGYYQTYIRADSVGTKTVRATAGGSSASRQLEVLPTASVGLVDVPQQVFEGEGYEVCSEINSRVEARVLLLRDGRIVESTNAQGEVCFDREATQPGNHVYEVRALTAGEDSSSRASVRVLETDVEVDSFPGQVASVESGDGIVKIDLYNTQNEVRRYDLELQGLPSTWLSQSEKQVVLDSGERRTVYFYLTPRDEGDYDPEVVVSAENQEIYRETVDLEVGGQEEPRRRGLLERLGDFFSF